MAQINYTYFRWKFINLTRQANLWVPLGVPERWMHKQLIQARWHICKALDVHYITLLMIKEEGDACCGARFSAVEPAPYGPISRRPAAKFAPGQKFSPRRFVADSIWRVFMSSAFYWPLRHATPQQNPSISTFELVTSWHLSQRLVVEFVLIWIVVTFKIPTNIKSKRIYQFLHTATNISNQVWVIIKNSGEKRREDSRQPSLLMWTVLFWHHIFAVAHQCPEMSWLELWVLHISHEAATLPLRPHSAVIKTLHLGRVDAATQGQLAAK